MAKYSRYDSRNKKKDRHKNQYLDRGSMGRKNRERHEASIFSEEDELFEKYGLRKTLDTYE